MSNEKIFFSFSLIFFSLFSLFLSFLSPFLSLSLSIYEIHEVYEIQVVIYEIYEIYEIYHIYDIYDIYDSARLLLVSFCLSVPLEFLWSFFISCFSLHKIHKILHQCVGFVYFFACLFAPESFMLQAIPNHGSASFGN